MARLKLVVEKEGMGGDGIVQNANYDGIRILLIPSLQQLDAPLVEIGPEISMKANCKFKAVKISNFGSSEKSSVTIPNY